jgi:hypothetical protein
MPKTRPGKWADWLFVVGFVLLALLMIAYNTEALGGLFKEGIARKALWVVAAISAVATLVTGAVSWLRFKDRSVVVMVATIYGFSRPHSSRSGQCPNREARGDRYASHRSVLTGPTHDAGNGLDDHPMSLPENSCVMGLEGGKVQGGHEPLALVQGRGGQMSR